jgi:hypothetical protein
VNLLSVLAPTSKPVDPFDVGGNIVTQVATAAAIKTLDIALQPAVARRL